MLDLYFEKKLKQNLEGYTQLVRYADDFLIGIQHKVDAAQIQTELTKRLQKFGLKHLTFWDLPIIVPKPEMVGLT